MNAIQNWDAYGATSRGRNHQLGDIENQDAFCIQSDAQKQTLVVVLCDGAGSAKFAEQGAKHFSNDLAKRFCDVAKVLKGDFNDTKRRKDTHFLLMSCIDESRKVLANDAQNLSDFHATLTALIITKSVHITLHIGDSPIAKSEVIKRNEKVDHFSNLTVSTQQRSEYAEETKFVTMNDWQQSVEATWFPVETSNRGITATLYCLMSDGAADVALCPPDIAGDRKIFRPFSSNLLANLVDSESHKRNAVIEAALDHPGTFGLTGDDKTIVIVAHKSVFDTRTFEPYLTESKVPEPVVTSSVTNPPGNQNTNTQDLGSDTESQKAGPMKRNAVRLGVVTSLVVCVLFLMRNQKTEPDQLVQFQAAKPPAIQLLVDLRLTERAQLTVVVPNDIGGNKVELSLLNGSLNLAGNCGDFSSGSEKYCDITFSRTEDANSPDSLAIPLESVLPLLGDKAWQKSLVFQVLLTAPTHNEGSLP